jgi:hypothetical protein
MRFNACTHLKTLSQPSRQNIIFPSKTRHAHGGILTGQKNESWNFQEWFAQGCFSDHGDLVGIVLFDVYRYGNAWKATNQAILGNFIFGGKFCFL